MKYTTDNGERQFVVTDDAVHASGGEADLHRQGPFLLKIYRRPEAIPAGEPDYATKVSAATRRLEEGVPKLSHFPLDLPVDVVAPLSLLYDERGRFAGFVMAYKDNVVTLHDLLEDPTTDIGLLISAFKSLRTLMLAVHDTGVVIADVAPKNILVAQDGTTVLVDADSMQYGRFMSPAITRNYTDPLRFGKARDPFLWPTPQSDWYAYAAMLFQALFRIRPFEGEMKPGRPYLEFEERIRQRITAFHSSVRVPVTARPFGIVPAPVMDYFVALFERDLREPFREDLLDMLRWKYCALHTLPYARERCPQCIDAVGLRQMSGAERRAYRPVAPEVFLPSRKLTCFTTTGRILAASADDRLRVLYREHDGLRRERNVLVDASWPRTRSTAKNAAYAISGSTSLVAADGTVYVYGTYDQPGQAPLASEATRPMLGVSGGMAYVLNGTKIAPVAIRGQHGASTLSVPNHNAWFWMGKDVGLALSHTQVGGTLEGLFFGVAKRGLGHVASLTIDDLGGIVQDVGCYFGDDRMWLLVLVQTPAGMMRTHIRVYDFKGAPVFKGKYPARDYFCRVRGHAAVGKTLAVLDNTMLLRLSVEGDILRVVGALQKALPFVQPQTWLLPATDEFGFAVHMDSITPVKIPEA